MRLTRVGALAVLAASPLMANSIEVTYQPTVFLRGGDALEFRFSSWSYRAHTGTTPESMVFQLQSLALDPGAEFRATLESPDGAISADIEGLRIASGYFQGTLYRGPVWTVSGSLEVSSALADVFAGPAAVLVLRNTGRDVTLGVPPYGIASSLGVSLGGNGLSVGGIVVSAKLDTAALQSPLTGSSDGFFVVDSGPEAVPEPSSLSLLIVSGAFLFLFWSAMKRRRRAHTQ